MQREALVTDEPWPDAAPPLPTPPADEHEDGDGPRLRLRVASDVSIRRTEFMWGGRIPRGELTIVCGIGGLGKSQATGALLTTLVTRGRAAPDLGPGRVLLSSAEDDPEATLVPRLMAAGADLDLVEFIEPSEDDSFHGLTLPDDIDLLAKFIRERQPTLLVIDPISSHLASNVDSHRDANLRQAIDPLGALAHEYGVTIVVVAHLNKSASSDLYVRLSGSTGFFNAARSVLLFAADPEADPDEDVGLRVLIHGKCNVGPHAPGLRLRVESAEVPSKDGDVSTSKLVVLGETNLDISDALAPLDDEERTKTSTATEWLAEALRGGSWWPVEDLKAQHDEHKHGSWRTVRRAAKRLGVEKDKKGMDSGWRWRLPPGLHVLES